MSTKIVRMFGGQMDGRKIRSDRLPGDDWHPGNAELLLIDDDAPVGEPHAVYEYVAGHAVRHDYEIAAHSLIGDVHTIVLTPAQNG